MQLSAITNCVGFCDLKQSETDKNKEIEVLKHIANISSHCEENKWFFREENNYLALEPNPVVETLFHF